MLDSELLNTVKNQNSFLNTRSVVIEEWRMHKGDKPIHGGNLLPWVRTVSGLTKCYSRVLFYILRVMQGFQYLRLTRTLAS